MEFPYFELLKKSWKICWRHKILWFFGLFVPAGFTFPNLNFSFGDIFPLLNKTESSGSRPQLIKDLSSLNELSLVLSFFKKNLHWILLALLSLFFLFVLIQIISWLSKPALIKLVEEVERENKSPSLKKGFNHGLTYLIPFVLSGWSLWLPYLLLFLPVTSGIAISILTFSKKPEASLGYLFISILLAIVLVLISIPLSMLTELVHRQIVIENQSILNSLKEGFKMFSVNWSKFLAAWLISLVVSFIFGLVTVLALIPFFLIFLSIGFLPVSPTGESSIFYLTLFLLLFLLPAAVIFTLAKAISGAFLTNFWTLIYLEIQKISQHPKQPGLPLEITT